MKTSSKILLGALIGFSLLSLIFMVTLRSSMVVITSIEDAKGNNGKAPITVPYTDLAPFESLNIKNFHGNTTIRQGDKYEVNIRVDEGQQDKIKVESENGELKIYLEGKHFSARIVEAEVIAPSLRVIQSRSNGLISNRVEGENRPTADSLIINLTGNGSVELDYDVKWLNLTTIGNGTTYIRGNGDEVSVSATGNGTTNLSGFNAKKVICNASGNGHTHVHATESIQVYNTGNGSVKYSGGAPQTNIQNIGNGYTGSD